MRERPKTPLEEPASTPTPLDRQFFFLGLQVIVIHTVASNCHERIFVDGTFKLPWFLTAVEFVLNVVLTMADSFRRGTLRELLSGYYYGHLVCAIAMTICHGCTNAALVHLNFTTSTIFKSAKVFFVMTGGMLVHGRPVSTREWISSVVLFFGLALFGLADHLSSLKFMLEGVWLVLGSLMAGSVAANWQQKTMQIENGRSDKQLKDDMMFFQYSISAVLCFAVTLFNGEMGEGLLFFDTAGQNQIINIAVFMGCSFWGLHPLMSLIQRYDATSATVVTSLRKVVTFTTSFIIFPKPFTLMHLSGMVLSVGAAYALEKARGAEHKAAIKPPRRNMSEMFSDDDAPPDDVELGSQADTSYSINSNGDASGTSPRNGSTPRKTPPQSFHMLGMGGRERSGGLGGSGSHLEKRHSRSELLDDTTAP